MSKKQIKWIVSDLDGTLLNKEHRISRETVQAVRAAQNMGVETIIVTGRMCRSAFPFYEQLNLKMPLVAYNGSFVKDIKQNKLLLHENLLGTHACELIEIAHKEEVSIQVYVDDVLYTDRITPYVQAYLDTDKVEANVVTDLMPIARKGPTKIILLDKEQHLKRMWKVLAQKYAGQIYVTKSHPNLLEFVNIAANKGQAVQFLAQFYGIEKDEMMACGDNYNDIPLLQAAGLQVAMGNGVDAVKEVANYVAPSNEENGVAQAIEKFVLNRK